MLVKSKKREETLLRALCDNLCALGGGITAEGTEFSQRVQRLASCNALFKNKKAMLKHGFNKISYSNFLLVTNAQSNRHA